MFKIHYVFILSLIVKSRCKMEGFIVEGDIALIKDYPYSVNIRIDCENLAYRCGGSLINQELILTAAHCLRICQNNEIVQKIYLNLGTSEKQGGFQTIVSKYVTHENFDTRTQENDIALLKMKVKVTLGSTISRVAIMQNPPNIIEDARVAGWGLIDDVKMITAENLMQLSQVVWDKKVCERYYGSLSPGQFCASSRHHSQSQYLALGDSGAALVIEGYIQIGLVSYKIPTISKSLVVYTNVSYYYSWIIFNARRLYCH